MLVAMTDDDFRSALGKVLASRPDTQRIADCIRLVASGLVADDVPVNTPFPPAFLPVWFPSQNLAYGAWLVDPVAPAVELVGMILDAPKPTAESVGRTGLVLLANMLDAVATEDRSRVQPMVDLVFGDRSLDDRARLADAVRRGFDPSDVGEVRSLPVMRDLWSDDDLPRTEYPAPLSTMFERNAKPVEPADYTPTPPRRPEFDALLAAGDVPGAWAVLNDSGWGHAECVDAFDAIAPHIDEDYMHLIRSKLSSVLGPTLGY